MEIVDCAYRLRCELGVCRNFARHTLKFSRTGIRSAIHICGDCLKELRECVEKREPPDNAPAAEGCGKGKERAEAEGGSAEGYGKGKERAEGGGGKGKENAAGGKAAGKRSMGKNGKRKGAAG